MYSVVGHQRAGGGVEIGAPARSRMRVGFPGRGLRVAGVHLAVQALELGQGQVAGAAAGRGLAPGGRVGGLEVLAALGRQVRAGQDVGGGVQVALRVPADELPVPREGDVALDHAGAHAGGRQHALPRVLGKLQRRAPVRDREAAGGVGPAPRRRPAGAPSGGRASCCRRGRTAAARAEPARRRLPGLRRGRGPSPGPAVPGATPIREMPCPWLRLRADRRLHGGRACP